MPPFSCSHSSRSASIIRSYSDRRVPARLTQVFGVGKIATVFSIGLITPIPPEMPGSIPTIKVLGIISLLSAESVAPSRSLDRLPARVHYPIGRHESRDTPRQAPPPEWAEDQGQGAPPAAAATPRPDTSRLRDVGLGWHGRLVP